MKIVQHLVQFETFRTEGWIIVIFYWQFVVSGKRSGAERVQVRRHPQAQGLRKFVAVTVADPFLEKDQTSPTERRNSVICYGNPFRTVRWPGES
jgi:hypothetical protein